MRLFINEPHTHSVPGGGSVGYMAGHFYMIEDPALADELHRSGKAFTEEEHAALTAPKPEPGVEIGFQQPVDAPEPDGIKGGGEQ